jgi:hypothetical protein
MNTVASYINTRESESDNCTHQQRAGTYTRLAPLISFPVRKNTRKTSIMFSDLIEFHREVTSNAVVHTAGQRTALFSVA